MRTILFISFITISLLSCKTKKAVVGTLAKDYVVLQKADCMEERDVFTLKVYDTGEMLYIGKKNVSKIGSHTRNLTEQENKRMWEIVKFANPNSLKPLYDRAESAQMTYYTFHLNDSDKKTAYCKFPPEVIKMLEAFMLEKADQGSWKEIESKKKK